MHQSDWVTGQDSCINFPTHTAESKQQFGNINSLIILEQLRKKSRKPLFEMLVEFSSGKKFWL